MSIKKSLIALAVMALALMGFVSTAMAATDGVVRDVTTGALIPENRELHFIGAASFVEEGGNTGVECHVTSVAKVTGSTGTGGDMTNLSVPDTTKCTSKGLFAGCVVSTVIFTNVGTITFTPANIIDLFPVPGKNIVIHITLSGFLCPTSFTVTLPSAILKPLNTTGKHAATNTSGNLGTTAAAGESIAGAELEAKGEAHISGIGTVSIVAKGELELTAADRCTWKLVSS